MWALTLVLIVISPIIATSATFAVYVLIDEDNVLTASRSFSVLLLFSALRFPINFAGRLLGSTFDLSWSPRFAYFGSSLANSLIFHLAEATQAYSAVKRITKFLEREVRPEETAIDDRAVSGDEGTPLVLERAVFFTDSGERPAFQCSERVVVEKGEVLAVCGPVGGKRTHLLRITDSFVTQLVDCFAYSASLLTNRQEENHHSSTVLSTKCQRHLKQCSK